MKKVSFQLEELVCPMCGQKIETSLMKQPGISSCKVSYSSSKAKVEYDETVTDPGKIRSVIEQIGYIVTGVK